MLIPKTVSMTLVKAMASIVLTGSACAFAVDEVNVCDLRLGGGVLPKTYRGGATSTVTNSGGTVTSTTSTSPTPRSPDANYRGQLQFMTGHLGSAGGFLIGGDLAVNQARFENSTSTTTFTTPVIDLLIGYGFAPTPSWHFELTPFVGYGWTFFNVSNNNQTDTSSHENYIEYGARAATYWTFKSGWQIGVEVPYLIGRSKPEYTSTDKSTGDRLTVSDDRKNQGFGVLASLGVRF